MPNLTVKYPTDQTLRPANIVEWLGLVTSTITELKGEDWFNQTAFTLKELTASLANDKNFAQSMQTALDKKLDAVDYNAADVLAKLKTVDGINSGLDADLVRGYVPVNKAGDTMTGYLTLHADPTNATHAATKRYVDELLQGFSIKKSVRAVTTTNITLSGLQTVDGVVLKANDRVLVRAQTDNKTNGIYYAATGAWTRTEDFNETRDVQNGLAVFVNEGTDYADSGWVLITDGAVTIGTSAITFEQFSGAGQITPVDGLYKDGNRMGLTNTGVTAGQYTLVNVDRMGRVTSASKPNKVEALGVTPVKYADGTGYYTTTHSGTTYANQWTKLATVNFTAGFAHANFELLLIGGNDGGPGYRKARIAFRIKQQAPMGQAPVGELLLEETNAGIAKEHFAAVVRSNTATETVTELYMKNPAALEAYNFTPMLQNTNADITFHSTTGYIASLPAGQVISCGDGNLLLTHKNTMATNTTSGHVITGDGIGNNNGNIFVDAGDGVTLTGTSPNKKVQADVDGSTIILSGTSPNKKIAHADTSNQASITNTNNTVIQSVSVDGMGHVTSMSSKTLTYSDVSAVPDTDVVTTATANKILKLNSSSKLPASITGNADGNAATATKLQTARTIALTGDVTGSVSFDGTGNVALSTTYRNSGVTPGTYTKVTVDAKGNVTSASAPSSALDLGINDVKMKDGTNFYRTTDSGSDNINKWTKFAAVNLPYVYDFANAKILVMGGGASNYVMRKAVIDIRVKQQSAMGQAPGVTIAMTEASYISKDNFKAVVVSNTATETVVEFYVQNPSTFEQLIYTPILQNSRNAVITFFENQPYLDALPAGSVVSCSDDELMSTHKNTIATTSQTGHVALGDGIGINGSNQIYVDAGDGVTLTGTSPNKKVQADVDGTTIVLSGTSPNKKIAHADTSNQSSITNSNNTVIQSISVDGMGHVTSMASKQLTPAVVGSVNLTGDTMTGDLVINKQDAVVALKGTNGSLSKWRYNEQANASVMSSNGLMYFRPMGDSDTTGQLAIASSYITFNGKSLETQEGAQSKATVAQNSAQTYTDQKIAALIDSSPDTLNTLNEIAQALGDDPNFATTMTNNLAKKVDKSGSVMTGRLEFGPGQAIAANTMSSDIPTQGLRFTGHTDNFYMFMRDDNSTTTQQTGLIIQMEDDADDYFQIEQSFPRGTTPKRLLKINSTNGMDVDAPALRHLGSQVWTAATFDPASKAAASHTSELATTSAFGHVKVGDAIAVNSGVISVDYGQGLTMTGTSPNKKLQAHVDGTSITFNANNQLTHYDTSSQASITNTGASVIQSVALDGYGHVTSMSTKTLSYSDVGAVPTSDVVTTATANKLLKLDSNAKLPASITGDADSVDGIQGANILRKDIINTGENKFSMGTYVDPHSGVTYALKVSGGIATDKVDISGKVDMVYNSTENSVDFVFAV